VLSEKQRGVLTGMTIGMIITVAALSTAIFVHPRVLMSEASEQWSAIAHALKWDVLVVSAGW
jgi:hypothetical protein